MESFAITPYPIGWYLAAFSSDVGVAEVKRLHYFGQELVCFRGQDGLAHVLDAYCPHQGANLGVGGFVGGNDIVCPFHAWRFSGEGLNTRIPYAPCDTGALLQPWTTRELDGMIYVWYHPDHEEPTWEPQPVPEFNDAAYPPSWHSDPIEMTVPLQETYENAVDAAHFVQVHRAHAMPTVNVLKVDGPLFIAELPDQTLRSDRGPFQAVVTSDLWGLGIDIARMKSDFMHIVYMHLQTPIDEKRIEIRFHITCRRLNKEDGHQEPPEFVARIGEGLLVELRNDKVIWDNKIYRPSPRLAENEGPVLEYRRWAQQFYPKAALETAGA